MNHLFPQVTAERRCSRQSGGVERLLSGATNYRWGSTAEVA